MQAPARRVAESPGPDPPARARPPPRVSDSRAAQAVEKEDEEDLL